MALGIAGQLPDNLSEYMKVGRSQRPGPVTGVIECFSVSQENYVTQGSNLCRGHTYITGPYTVLAVTWNVRVPVGSPDMRVAASLTATPFTFGIEISPTVDMFAISNGIVRSAGLTNKDIDGDTSPWLGVWLSMLGSTIKDLAVTVWFMRHGHSNLAPVDD